MSDDETPPDMPPSDTTPFVGAVAGKPKKKFGPNSLLNKTEVADELGLSRPYVSRQLRKIKYPAVGNVPRAKEGKKGPRQFYPYRDLDTIKEAILSGKAWEPTQPSSPTPSPSPQASPMATLPVIVAQDATPPEPIRMAVSQDALNIVVRGIERGIAGQRKRDG